MSDPSLAMPREMNRLETIAQLSCKQESNWGVNGFYVLLSLHMLCDKIPSAWVLDGLNTPFFSNFLGSRAKPSSLTLCSVTPSGVEHKSKHNVLLDRILARAISDAFGRWRLREPSLPPLADGFGGGSDVLRPKNWARGRVEIS
jgi:hypothetical protein